MAKKGETLFQNKVIRELKSIKKCWHINLSMIRVVGCPDLVGCINGRFFALELKMAKGRLSPAQKRFRDVLEYSGALWYSPRPDTWNEIREDLTRKAFS